MLRGLRSVLAVFVGIGVCAPSASAHADGLDDDVVQLARRARFTDVNVHTLAGLGLASSLYFARTVKNPRPDPWRPSTTLLGCAAVGAAKETVDEASRSGSWNGDDFTATLGGCVMGLVVGNALSGSFISFEPKVEVKEDAVEEASLSLQMRF